MVFETFQNEGKQFQFAIPKKRKVAKTIKKEIGNFRWEITRILR